MSKRQRQRRCSSIIFHLIVFIYFITCFRIGSNRQSVSPPECSAYNRGFANKNADCLVAKPTKQQIFGAMWHLLPTFQELLFWKLLLSDVFLSSFFFPLSTHAPLLPAPDTLTLTLSVSQSLSHTPSPPFFLFCV